MTAELATFISRSGPANGIFSAPGSRDSGAECRPRCAAALRDEQCQNFELGSSVPYLLAMPKYKPITTLTSDWERLMEAFFALFYCHAMLWSVGIRHGDISERNLMWDPMTDKAKLCDFDFSHSSTLPEVGVPECASSGFTGFSSTGTWIFMAKDLLTHAAMSGRVRRVYRHEVEAFVAVLVWICWRYDDGELRSNPPFENWKDVKYQCVCAQRTEALELVRKRILQKPSDLPDKIWEAICRTLTSVTLHQDKVRSLGHALDAIEEHVQFAPDEPPPTMPESIDDWNDLRTLRLQVLSWAIFKMLPAAEVVVKLIQQRILNPPNKEKE